MRRRGRFPACRRTSSSMAPEHELAHLCVHLDRHAVTYRSLVRRKNWCELLLLPHGLGRLAWLYDIALYLQRRSELIDWDSFVDTARRWAIDGRVYAHARAVATRVGRRTTARGPAGAESRSTAIGRTDRTQRGVGVASRQRNAAQRIRAHTASALADAAIRSVASLRSHLDLGLPAQRLLACQVRHAERPSLVARYALPRSRARVVGGNSRQAERTGRSSDFSDLNWKRRKLGKVGATSHSSDAACRCTGTA